VKSNLGLVKAISTHLKVLNFDFYEFFSFSKAKFHQINKIQCSTKWQKTAVLELLDCPKVISRKICMTEKSFNFNTVNHKQKKI